MGIFARRAVVVLAIAVGGFAFWAANASAATFLVTNTKDAGPGSLRDAIVKANLTAAADSIKFAIPLNAYPGVGFRTISLQSPLDQIIHPVMIDGTSEPGYSGTPLIRIDAGCGCDYLGFSVNAPQVTIRGLSITNFGTAGISLDTGGGHDTVAGNWIGLDQVGNGAGNGTGIIVNTSGNLIGGTTPLARNVISDNTTNGITISGLVATKNVVSGNYIGLDATGSDYGNLSEGVEIQYGATGNVIGGLMPAARNVISANGDSGVQISTSGTSGNLVEGNYLGTDPTGTVADGNGEAGVAILTGASGNTVGGTAAGARNLISGNSDDGVDLDAPGNVLAGNYIGTNADATATLPNVWSGVTIVGANNNTVGGTAAGAGNVIAGNGYDGILQQLGKGNVIAGNFIGLAKVGVALPNGCDGVEIQNTSGVNTIGGSTPAARNVISANGGTSPCPNSRSGVDLNFAKDTVVAGNYIGTNITGTSALGNHEDGVVVRNASTSNIIGGTTSGARNVISGNYEGVFIIDANTSGNVVEGNYIGTNATGTAAIPNPGPGVYLDGTESSNTVGGTVAGARNVISGNGVGISLFGSSNNVEGNYIGTNAAGNAALGNACNGIAAYYASSTNNTIGGTVAGARNVISGNGTTGGCYGAASGIDFQDATDTNVEGNYIGTNASGTAALGNYSSGVTIEGASNNVAIGFNVPGSGNVISGNRDDGVDILNTAHGNLVYKNFIGTNAAGTAPLGNVNFGIYVASSGSNNDIGDPSDGNVIAFNGVTTDLAGVEVDGAVGVYIIGNSMYSNGGLGISLVNGGNHNQPAPVITKVTTAGGMTTIDGSLDAAPTTRYYVEFFANTTCDPSGFGEGLKPVGTYTVDTNASGHADFEAVFPALSPSMKFVSATALDGTTVDTSQFSNCTSH